LQDYLFRALAREAGKAGLVVPIHTGIGADPYFAIAGGNPLLLLAIALTGMVDDGEITIARALQIARMVLRENAVKLYGLDSDR